MRAKRWMHTSLGLLLLIVGAWIAVWVPLDLMGYDDGRWPMVTILVGGLVMWGGACLGAHVGPRLGDAMRDMAAIEIFDKEPLLPAALFTMLFGLLIACLGLLWLAGSLVLAIV